VPVAHEPAPPVPAAVAGDEVQVLVARTSDAPAGPWLAPALARAAATDPALGTRLLPAVLAGHARRSDRDLSYDLVAEGTGSWHVRLRNGTAAVDRREGGTGGDVDFALHGPLAALLAFAAGGTGRRPADVRVSGRKRRLRKLLKALRAPVGLADVAVSGGHVGPVDLLRLLVAGVDPAVLPGHGFSVDYVLGDGLVVHVAVADGAAEVRGGPAPEGAAAVVETSDRALLALLGGAAPPPGERVVVRGSPRAPELLHGWFDDVQGLRR
jgi:hypothetical protein